MVPDKNEGVIKNQVVVERYNLLAKPEFLNYI